MKNYKKLLTVLTLTTLTLTSCGNKNEEKNSNNSNPSNIVSIESNEKEEVTNVSIIIKDTVNDKEILNGEMAEVGIGDYLPKENDQIEFRFEQM